MAPVVEGEVKKKPSLIVQGAVLLLVTALAGGMGWYTGGYLETHTPPSAAEPGTVKDWGTPENETDEAAEQPAPPPSVLPLDPITTNLADPHEVWVRMEVAAVFNGTSDPALAQSVHQDLLAYVRTVKLRQIETASGFQHLKADLRERARIRSEGRIDDILILTFLYE